ncbi:structural protein [Hydrogenovibrio sp. SC-1]|uniref:structural protein n=1 Tax=Hydrogenovibrio sp. SC-1 TaxID=2065820 RepID=UPI000C7CD54E|nr:structural protein [Hydrogenovibrio sp. SC-1]PLA73505.1 structural protein [Hydrogenovibrio sp. SC-1]
MKNYLIGGAILIAAYWGYRMNLPKGIRNNNPGNLEANNINWRGKIGDDGRFVIFDKMENGVRAMTLDITGDFYKDGNRTVRGLITEYAPGHENNVEAYVNHVSSKMGVNPDEFLTDLKPYLNDMIAAMILHENGREIADYDLMRGIQSAMEYRGIA